MTASTEILHALPSFNSEAEGIASGIPRMVLVGPPGTGKTYSLMQAWLEPAVRNGFPVLAVTFTKSVAQTMRSRLSLATQIPEDRLKDTCRTIHSECHYRMRINLGQVKMYDDKGEFDTLSDDDDADQEGWMSLMEPCRELHKEALRIWDKARQVYFPADMVIPLETLVSRMHREQESHFDLGSIISEVRHYEDAKRATGTWDFTDFLIKNLDFTPINREALIVDEAQDVSPLLIAVVEHWATRSHQLVWIGDPDQGIFSFAGADGKFLTRQIREGVTSRRLAYSHRVPQAAHKVARELISLNEDRVDAPYEPNPLPGSVKRYAEPAQALEVAVKYLEENPKAQGFILARSGKALTRYGDLLKQEGVPYLAERGMGSPMSRSVAIAILVAVSDLRDRGSVRAEDAWRLAQKLSAEKMPGTKTLRWFTGTKKQSLDLLEKWTKEDPDQALDARSLINVAGLKIQPFTQAKSVQDAIQAGGDRFSDGDDLKPLLRIIERYGMKALRETPRLRLTTFHTAKGREGEMVVVDLDCPKPCEREIYKSREGCESERRALYVAITRTKDQLLLVNGVRGDLGDKLGLRIREVA